MKPDGPIEPPADPDGYDQALARFTHRLLVPAAGVNRESHDPLHLVSRSSAPRKEVSALLRNDGFDGYRQALFEEVRHRFGPLAAQHVAARLRSATSDEVIAWARRATFMLSYPELLDPAPLAVELVTPERLLEHAFGTPIQKTSLLLRFERSRDRRSDQLLVREHAPWFLDLPRHELAFGCLRLKGWLLLACAESAQADLLVRGTLAARQLSVRLIVPRGLAGESDAII
jgi:hypothetical protein